MIESCHGHVVAAPPHENRQIKSTPLLAEKGPVSRVIGCIVRVIGLVRTLEGYFALPRGLTQRFHARCGVISHLRRSETPLSILQNGRNPLAPLLYARRLEIAATLGQHAST
jgi:hypothetical protein